MFSVFKARVRAGSFINRAVAVLAALFAFAGLAAAAHPAAAAAYVGLLGDVKAEDRAVVASPQPVQVIFEFRTKGAPNAKATQFAKAKVLEAITQSGVFSQVSEQPVPNGAVLSVIIDNAVDPKSLEEAKMKGTVTGATLFIAGSNIRDDYIATLEYVSSPGAAPIKRQATHFIITQMGLINSAPEGAVKVGKMMDAFFVMVRQIVTNPLNEIARDPAFGGGATAPATVPVSMPEPAAAPAADPAPSTPAESAPAEPAPAADPAKPQA